MPLVPNPPQLVHELMNQTEATWNIDLVRQFFLPMDAEAILSIPLCTSAIDDFWSWHFESKGFFSVRSCYRMLVDMKTRRENWLDGVPGSSNSQQEGKSWTKLWHLNVPSKLKVFIWRLAQQSLPTTDLLQHRHMATRNTCSLCVWEDSWRHSLINCTMARCTWVLADESLTAHMAACTEPSAKNWLFAMNESLSHVQFSKLVISLWAIWFARRKAIHENIFQSPAATHQFIESYFTEVQSLEKPAAPRPTATHETRQRWLPPRTDHEKVNVDGAFACAGPKGDRSGIV